MKATTSKDMFLPQLKLIAKRYDIDLNTDHGYTAAYRILVGKGVAFD